MFATLTAVDGAVVVAQRFELLGFGGTVRTPERRPGHVLEPQPGRAGIRSIDQLNYDVEAGAAGVT